jgi:hypothetical protein
VGLVSAALSHSYTASNGAWSSSPFRKPLLDETVTDPDGRF